MAAHNLTILSKFEQFLLFFLCRVATLPVLFPFILARSFDFTSLPIFFFSLILAANF